MNENRSTQTNPPTQVGPYRIEALLGRGGMGEVYQGKDERNHVPVALKRLRPESAGNWKLKRRFAREARAAQSLKHPAIVEVFEVLDFEGETWIVMELLGGGSLADRLQKEGPFTAAEALPILAQVAQGLEAAHAEGLVHRDLKTENVFVTPTRRVKILDFGLSKDLAADPSHTGPLTTVGTAVGTSRAMAPEQAVGGDVDARADLFAFGVLIYEMLTGTSPFLAETPLMTITAVVSLPHPPIRDKNPRVPAELAAIVDRLLAKKREDRPASIGEVVRALDAIDLQPAGLSGWLRRLSKGP